MPHHAFSRREDPSSDQCLLLVAEHWRDLSRHYEGTPTATVHISPSMRTSAVLATAPMTVRTPECVLG